MKQISAESESLPYQEPLEELVTQELSGFQFCRLSQQESNTSPGFSMGVVAVAGLILVAEETGVLGQVDIEQKKQAVVAAPDMAASSLSGTYSKVHPQ